MRNSISVRLVCFAGCCCCCLVFLFGLVFVFVFLSFLYHLTTFREPYVVLSLCDIDTGLVQRIPASATARGLLAPDPTKGRTYLPVFHVLDGTKAKRLQPRSVMARLMAGEAGVAWRLHRVRAANTLLRTKRGPDARRSVRLMAWPYACASTVCHSRATPAINTALMVARVVPMGIK